MAKPTEFNTEQFSKAYPKGIEKTYWNLARNRIILKYIRKFHLKNLLDIGCGRGIVTNYLYNSGISITGVDLGDPPPSSESGCIIFYRTEAGALPPEIKAKIETITLFDVIEHIEQPQMFLQGIIRDFPNLKYLVLTIPARHELWSNFDDYYGHFRRYDLDSVEREAEGSGFKVIYSRYFFHTLYPLIRMNNLFFKKRELDIKAPAGAISRMINKMASVFFFIETGLLPPKLWGTSIIAVCKKSTNLGDTVRAIAE